MDKDTAIQMRDAILEMATSMDKYINMLEREEAGEEVSKSEYAQWIGEFMIASANVEKFNN